MTNHQADLLAAALVKLLIVVLGVACVYMGFSLFVKGIHKGGAGISAEASGGLRKDEAVGWKAAFALDKGGPGLVFALFGAVIAVVGVFRGFAITEKTTTTTPSAPPTQAPLSSAIIAREDRGNGDSRSSVVVVHEERIEGHVFREISDDRACLQVGRHLTDLSLPSSEVESLRGRLHVLQCRVKITDEGGKVRFEPPFF